MTTNAMTINLDDANLPIEGPAWEAMLEHVLANAGSGDLYEAIDAEWVKFNFDISDIYDDDEIVEYVQEAEIPIGEIYDDEEILACDCVKEKIAKLEKENEELRLAHVDQAFKDGWKMGWDGVDICEGRYGENGGCNADWEENPQANN
jgi:hypothetical protein